MTIYNKWGQQVFQSKEREKGWDGCGQNGALVPQGNYIYKVKVQGLDGQSYFLKGSIQVLR